MKHLCRKVSRNLRGSSMSLYLEIKMKCHRVERLPSADKKRKDRETALSTNLHWELLDTRLSSRHWGPSSYQNQTKIPASVACVSWGHSFFMTVSVAIFIIQSSNICMQISHVNHYLLLLLSCFGRVRLCVTPQTAAHQAPLSLGFSRQEPTGVGCHVLLQCMKVKSESEVVQSCPTPSDPTDGSPPGSPIPGILQARTLEWGAIAFSEPLLRAWLNRLDVCFTETK